MIEFPMDNTHWVDIEVDIEMEKKLPCIFEQLLGLVEVWRIGKVEYKEMEVHIHIDFERGAKFLYQGELCRV